MPTEKAADRYRLGLFALLAIFCGAAMYLGARAYAPVIGLGGLVAAPLAIKARKDWIGFGLLALLIVWAGVSIQWTPASNLHAVRSAKDLSRFTLLHLFVQLFACSSLAAAAASLSAALARRALLWLGWSLIAAVAVLTLEMFTHGALLIAISAAARMQVRPDLAIRNLGQSGDVAALLAWPVGLAFWCSGQRFPAFVLAVFVPANTVLLHGFAPLAALIASVPVFWWALKGGRPALLAMLGLAAAYTVLTPWVLRALDHSGAFAAMAAHAPPSWTERIRIWSFTCERLMDHPFRGWGLDASRAFPDGIHLHPHSQPLQLWFELGALGSVLGAAFWAWIFFRLSRMADNGRTAAAVGAATATVYLAIGAVGFGIWQEWWICLGALALVACLLAGKLEDQPAFSNTAMVT